MEFNKEEYNMLCAKFMGYKLHYIDDEKTQPYLVHNDKYIKSGGTILLYKGIQLKYDAEWELIMEVLLSIQSIKQIKHTINSNGLINVVISKTWLSNQHTVEISFDVTSLDRKFIFVQNENKKQAIIEAIYQFLTWYYNN